MQLSLDVHIARGNPSDSNADVRSTVYESQSPPSAPTHCGGNLTFHLLLFFYFSHLSPPLPTPHFSLFPPLTPKSSYGVCRGRLKASPKSSKMHASLSKWEKVRRFSLKMYKKSFGGSPDRRQTIFGTFFRLKLHVHLLSIARLYFSVQFRCVKWRLALTTLPTPICKEWLILRLQKYSGIKASGIADPRSFWPWELYLKSDFLKCRLMGKNFGC